MIFAIKPFEIHDGDGIRTTVFFKGCPLRCKWCHNPESLSPRKQISYDSELCLGCLECVSLCDANRNEGGTHIFIRESCTVCESCADVCTAGALEIYGAEYSAEMIAEEVLRDATFMKESGGGVTFSGGEPLMQAELCTEAAKLLKANGINVAIDTSGFVKREAIGMIAPYADTFLFDIKAIDDEVHKFCTGVSNGQILSNIAYVDHLGIPMEIRYPYVPGMNDCECEKIARFVMQLKNVKCLRILPYHNLAERKYKCLGLTYPLPDVPVPTKEELADVGKRMKSLGIKNVLTN